jgi:hypothetical protein
LDNENTQEVKEKNLIKHKQESNNPLKIWFKKKINKQKKIKDNNKGTGYITKIKNLQ